MLQVAQYQKNGQVEVLDIPIPNCLENGVLVRTAYSVISAGTEKTSVNNAKGTLISRAKKQPEQVKLVLDTIKKQGLVNTFFRVKNKLNSYKQIGYSLSGIVVQSKCDEFRPGDKVACGGAGYANHAEYVSVPKNLVVKIPDNVSLIDAAYTTIASIAIQGVRQADVKLGENVAVVGLGLLGQITTQLLRANGCRVVGLDLNEELFEDAKKSGCLLTLKSDFSVINSTNAFTNGLGFDAVIITAGTSSNEPLNLAMHLVRKKGNVVIVGAVGMNLQRNPFYTKEVNLKISCSYGPGRYDPLYEEFGQDYPAAFVRWTENRNMMSFVDLLSRKQLDISNFTSFVFDIKKAAEAYKIITGEKKEKFLGIVLDYNLNEEKVFASYNKELELYSSQTLAKNQTQKNKDTKDTKVQVGFIGAGQFASNYILPHLKNRDKVELTCVVNNTPLSSETIAKQFGFQSLAQNYTNVVENKNIDMVFCATRHNLHAEIVIKSLSENKYVFVEKPLALSTKELKEIITIGQKNKNLFKVMVGFNRRFSLPFIEINKFFSGRTEPMIVSYRVNAGHIPKSHWTQQEEQGKRIIGEACHFFDVMLFLIKSSPIRVFAESLSINSVDKDSSDNVVVVVKFSDGSVGKLEYLANGSNVLPKEYCEVFCQGKTAIMDNFTNIELYSGKKVKHQSFDGEKGIGEEIRQTLLSVSSNQEMPIAVNELIDVSLLTFATNLSLEKAIPINFTEFKQSVIS